MEEKMSFSLLRVIKIMFVPSPPPARCQIS